MVIFMSHVLVIKHTRVAPHKRDSIVFKTNRKGVYKMQQTISRAYILGIKEGRSMYDRFPDTDKRQAMINAAALMRTHSGVMRDIFRGERDFWKHQLEKESTQ